VTFGTADVAVPGSGGEQLAWSDFDLILCRHALFHNTNRAIAEILR
jgi:hypothetical protein